LILVRRAQKRYRRCTPGHSVHPDGALDVFPLRTPDAYQIVERRRTGARQTAHPTRRGSGPSPRRDRQFESVPSTGESAPSVPLWGLIPFWAKDEKIGLSEAVENFYEWEEGRKGKAAYAVGRAGGLRRRRQFAGSAARADLIGMLDGLCPSAPRFEVIGSALIP
jgi:hypothetical protein